MKHGSGLWDALFNNIQSRGHVSDRPPQKSRRWIKEQIKMDKRMQTDALGRQHRERIKSKECVFMFKAVIQVVILSTSTYFFVREL